MTEPETIESGVYQISEVEPQRWLAERPEIVAEVDTGGSIHMAVWKKEGPEVEGGTLLVDTHRWLLCQLDGVKLYVVREQPTEECPQGRFRLFLTKRTMAP